MSKYKVGDVAALFAKPKEPTTQAGKKLQTLFREFHGDNKSTFEYQVGSSKQNDKSKIESEGNENKKIFQKSKKRKYSATFSQESNLNEKPEGTDNQEASFKNNKNFSEERDFPRKKKKKSKLNLFNASSNTEINGSSDNNITPTNSELNCSQRMKKVKPRSVKKSKHEVYDTNDYFIKGESEISNGNAQALDSNDELLKEEIQTFMQNNFKKSKKKNRNNSDSKRSPCKKSNKDGSLFVEKSVNTYESETISNFKNSSDNKIQEYDFIRRPKNQKKAVINKFEGNDYEKSKVSNKTVDNNDTLFKRKNGDFGENNTKKFKTTFINSYDSTHNSKTLFKKEPEFAKLLERNSEDKADQLSRTLFVGNLSVTTRLNDLKTLFSPFGEIQFIRFKGIETDKAKIFGENPSKSLNSNYAADTVPGFIVFKERESAVNALRLCGTVFKNRHITVDFAMPPGSKKIYDVKRSIFIGNLPFDIQDESIWNAFSDCGKIEGVRVVRDAATGIGKGFGYVLFSNEKSRENALSLEGLKIEERSIRIRAVDSNPKTQKKKDTIPLKRDTFKGRAIKIKHKNKIANKNSRKSIKKLVKKEKTLHKKKKIASLLQKSMK